MGERTTVYCHPDDLFTASIAVIRSGKSARVQSHPWVRRGEVVTVKDETGDTDA